MRFPTRGDGRARLAPAAHGGVRLRVRCLYDTFMVPRRRRDVVDPTHAIGHHITPHSLGRRPGSRATNRRQIRAQRRLAQVRRVLSTNDGSPRVVHHITIGIPLLRLFSSPAASSAEGATRDTVSRRRQVPQAGSDGLRDQRRRSSQRIFGQQRRIFEAIGRMRS